MTNKKSLELKRKIWKVKFSFSIYHKCNFSSITWWNMSYLFTHQFISCFDGAFTVHCEILKHSNVFDILLPAFLLWSQKPNHYQYCAKTVNYTVSEAYWEPCQTFKMERFAKIVNGYNFLTIFKKHAKLNIFLSM